MVGDVRWFFASERGRDEMLREEVTSLGAAAARDAAQVRSQLSRLQGDLEQRLTALSRAFDAYVELGDVREELRRLPDWSHTRSAVGEALGALQAGAHPESLDTQQHGHPMAYACNAVIAVVTGTPSPEAEEQARQQSNQAAAFVTAAAIAVGAGEQVADRLVDLLVNDGSLNPLQEALFRAAVTGLAGPNALAALEPAMSPALQRADWPTPLRGEATGQQRVHRLVSALVGAVQTPQEGDASEAALAGVRSMVAEMALAGDAEEAQLNRRAALLRERIENPTRAQSADDRKSGSTSVVDLVVDLARDPQVPQAARAQLLEWCRPSLRQVLDRGAELAPAPAAQSEVFNLGGVKVRVTADGADPSELRLARERVAGDAPDGFPVLFPVAGVLLLVAVILVVTGMVALGSVALIAAIGLAGYQWWHRRSQEAERVDAVEALDSRVERTRTKLKMAAEKDAADRSARAEDLALARQQLDGVATADAGSRGTPG